MKKKKDFFANGVLNIVENLKYIPLDYYFFQYNFLRPK